MEFAYQTDVGRVRPNNQDYVGLFRNHSHATLAIVADGMGGHQGGDVASEMAVSHIGYAFEKTQSSDAETVVKWLMYELQKENEQILARGQQFKDLTGMGTTIVAALMIGHRFVIANIGDSRAYLYRHGRLMQITEDHSLVNELVKSGDLTPEEAKNFPRKNVITRSLGIAPDVDADVTIYDMEANDMLLLCSDGLTKTVEDEDLAQIMAAPETLATKAKLMVQAANEAGGPDNVTALLIHNNQGGDDND